MAEQTGKIFKLIPKIMSEVGHIGKTNKNKQQGYTFRGIDDVYEHLQLLLAKHGVFSVPRVVGQHHEERKTKSGSVLIYRLLTIEYDFFADDGSCFTACVVGEGMDSGDKAGNKAMSGGHKYALLQVFAIPTKEAKDSEHESHELAPKSAAGKQQPVSNVYDGKSLEQKKRLATVMDAHKVPQDKKREVHEALINWKIRYPEWLDDAVKQCVTHIDKGEAIPADIPF